jgi:hypothetical protein
MDVYRHILATCTAIFRKIKEAFFLGTEGGGIRIYVLVSETELLAVQ